MLNLATFGFVFGFVPRIPASSDGFDRTNLIKENLHGICTAVKAEKTNFEREV